MHCWTQKWSGNSLHNINRSHDWECSSNWILMQLTNLLVFNAILESLQFNPSFEEFVATIKSIRKHLITICSEDFSPPSERYAAYSITFPFFLSAFFRVCFVLFFFNGRNGAQSLMMISCMCAAFFLTSLPASLKNLKYFRVGKASTGGLQK